MNKYVVTLGALALILSASFLVFNLYSYEVKQETKTVPEPYRATLVGEYVCLPQKDQSGPHTTKCLAGLKTDAGQYYSLDFNRMSQSEVVLVVGQRLTAAGVVTPIEYLSSGEWQKYTLVGIFSVTDALTLESEVFACDGDAKICPDGSSVGRYGPACEFIDCPLPSVTSSEVTTYLGGSVTSRMVTISPKEVISDSRCPTDVQCIWAGTVEVRTILTTPVSHGELVLILGEAQIFGDYMVTLIEVTPVKAKEVVTNSAYRFTFKIENR